MNLINSGRRRKGKRKGIPNARTGIPNLRRCRIYDCCERPAPIGRAQAVHDRGGVPDFEDFYSFECFNCGYVCRCEV